MDTNDRTRQAAQAISVRAYTWKMAAAIIAGLGAICGAYVGAQMMAVCTGSMFGTECELADGWPALALAGGVGGAMIAVPLLGVAHVLEGQARIARASVPDASELGEI